MSINRKNFIETLVKVAPGLDTREGITEQMTHFSFTGTHVQTFNSEVFAQAPFKTGFKGSIKGSILLDVLNEIQDDEITMTRTKKELKIKAKNTSAGFAIFVENELVDKFNMMAEIITTIKWKRLPPDFMAALKLCHFIASNEETEEGHACLQIGKDSVSSMDRAGIRIGLYQFEKPYFKQPFFFRAALYRDISVYEPIGYFLHDDFVFFKTKDPVIFAVRRRFFDFTDRSVIFDQFKKQIILLPDSIKDDIKVVGSVLTNEEKADREIEMTAAENKLKYKAKTELGWADRTAKIKYNKAEKRFALNPLLLTEALSKSDFENKLWLGKQGVMIKSGNFKYAVGYVE